MRKLAQRAALVAVMALGVSAGAAHAQKIGVVDINAVITALPEYQTANAQVQALSKKYQDSIQIMRTQYQATLETYQKLGETASPAFKQQETQTLDSMQNVFSKFQEDKFGQNGELAQMQTNLMKPITDKLTNALDSYAKKEKLAVILPKAGATLFADPAVDYTTKFQDYLKATASTAK